MKYNFDCVIIGCGIAGMTAAIYLKRANVNVLIIESGAPGGKLNSVTNIENYPGIKKITGPELAYSIYEQVESLNIEIRYGNVLSIKDHLITTDVEKISANKIIIATGRSSKKLELSSNFLNVSYCALCDGNLYKNKNIAIIGNESAIEEALYLSGIVGQVLLLSQQIAKEDKEIILDKNNIKLIEDCVIKTLNGENKTLKEIVTSKGSFEVDGLFISLGYEPSLDFLGDILKDNNYIVVDNNMQTNIDYIYACGDIIKKDVYQLTTAVGEAATAAINVKKNLK